MGLLFAFFCPIFYYCNISISHRVTSLLSLPECKGEIQIWREILWKLFLKSEREWVPVLLQPRECSRSTTDTQAVMYPHPPCAFDSSIYPYRYILSHTSKLSFNNSERVPTESRFILTLLLITMGNIFLISSCWFFGYCPQPGNISGDLAADSIGWSPMDLAVITHCLGCFFLFILFYTTAFSVGISGFI